MPFPPEKELSYWRYNRKDTKKLTKTIAKSTGFKTMDKGGNSYR